METLTVVTSGNDPQTPLMIRLFETCRENEPLKSDARFAVLTDQLSQTSVERLRSRSIKVIQFETEIADARETLSSDLHSFGKIGKPVLLNAFLLQDTEADDTIIYFDPDVVVLEPLAGLLANIPQESVAMPELLYPTEAWNHCVRQLRRAEEIAGRKIEPKGPEYCTGVMIGRRPAMLQLLEAWVRFQCEEPFNRLRNCDPGAKNAWHDQDFFRCFVRLYKPANLRGIPFHHAPTLNPPCDRLLDIELDAEVTPPQLRCTHTHWMHPPLICHFAGKTYESIPAAKEYYDSALVSASGKL